GFCGLPRILSPAAKASAAPYALPLQHRHAGERRLHLNAMRCAPGASLSCAPGGWRGLPVLASMGAIRHLECALPASHVTSAVLRSAGTLALAAAGVALFYALNLPLPFLFGPMSACLLAAL